MSISLTWWEDPKNKKNIDDYDEIETVRVKSVIEIKDLIANKPKRCTMITQQHTSFRLLKNGKRTDFQKVLWEKNRV